jgi:hypothetical protein
MAAPSLRSLLAERQAAAVVLARQAALRAVEHPARHSTALTPTARSIKMAAEANLSLFRQHAAVILAQQSALKAVRQRIQKEGKIKEPLPFSTLSRLANEWLRQHPELIAEAAADPIVVQMSQVSFKRRKPAAQGLPLCKSHERKSAPKGDPNKLNEGRAVR